MIKIIRQTLGNGILILKHKLHIVFIGHDFKSEQKSTTISNKKKWWMCIFFSFHNLFQRAEMTLFVSWASFISGQSWQFPAVMQSTFQGWCIYNHSPSFSVWQIEAYYPGARSLRRILQFYINFRLTVHWSPNTKAESEFASYSADPYKCWLKTHLL